MPRQKCHPPPAEIPNHQSIGRRAKWRADFQLAGIAETRHLIKSAAADDADAHWLGIASRPSSDLGSFSFVGLFLS
jgi:hypothetical protein